MFDKKAMELSINFLVILIISIVIFGLGVKFISELSKEAKDITTITTDELDRKIGSLICGDSERVCLGIDRKAIKGKDYGTFGLKIINILTPPSSKNGQDFYIIVSSPNPLGYKKDKTPITHPPLIVYPSSRSVFIKQNDETLPIAIGAQVPSDASLGTYILDVEIRTEIDGVPNQLYSPILKLYVEVV